ncbi:NAD(P)H-dependent oxidoreductase [Streptomyces sp. NPDC047097]|uniref:NADPH-dependent FMN reductase n=1 Tax=Streptomyces sp. NPDC047097 TaxID=3155260 RepID=UPI0033FA88E9
MSKKPIRLAVVVGSTRKGRIGPTVAKWFIEQAQEHGDFDLSVIDLAEAGLPSELSGPPKDGVYASSQVTAFAAAVAAADAFAVITPEYNRGYPSGLKLAIDSVYSEWHAKPVAFVSHGGFSGGLRAVEQLRQVFVEVHAMTIRDSVSFPMASEQFSEGGKPRDAEGAGIAAKQMLNQLVWWAEALRRARDDRPYAF